jgi:hypothetical protein
MQEHAAVLIERNGLDACERKSPIFDTLRTGAIVVYRALPEVHLLGETIKTEVYRRFGPDLTNRVIELMRDGNLRDDLQTYSAFYRVFRELRDSRFLSALFADLIEGWDLPKPILIDTGYCRMVAPRLWEQARARPDLFDPDQFLPPSNEAEAMIHGASWGHAHRDVDVRHYHFQINLWFPLHDLDKHRTLLLFPESYLRDVPQYGELLGPEHPEEWGFGKPLQVPLQFGDVLAFHSQHIHASPSQAPDKDRFTVEIRIAAGCIDDNASAYRRLFWALPNFQSRTPLDDLKDRVRPLADELPLQFDELALPNARTAHEVLRRLFPYSRDSLRAAYVRREQVSLDTAHSLHSAVWRQIITRLNELPCGDDLLLLVARILLRQGHKEMAVSVLKRISESSNSYFWMLEVGRVAAFAGFYELAEHAFSQAGILAKQSDVRLNRYADGKMPPPHSKRILQLLPKQALAAARQFSRDAHRRRSGREESLHYEHQVYWDGLSGWFRLYMRNRLASIGLLELARSLRRHARQYFAA